MKRLVAMTAIVLVWAAAAYAAPVAPKEIAADAKWFGHVDFDAIRSLKLVQELKEKCPLHQKCEAKMQEVEKKLGINPLEDIVSVTLYARHYGEHKGVALIRVKKLDRDKLLAELKRKHPDCKSETYGQRTLYTWTESHRGQTAEITGTVADDKLVVIGGSVKQVKGALDVLDGKKSSVAEDAPLLKDLPAEALMACRAIGVSDKDRKKARCPVLANVKDATVVWTAVEGKLTGKYQFTTISDASAKNFKAIVEGMVAAGRLRFGNIPEINKVIDGLTCTAEDDTFTATFAATGEQLKAAVKAAIEHRKARESKKPSHEPKKKTPKAAA